MQIKADSPEYYIDQLPDDRKPVIKKLREVILKNLPDGFVETMNYGMIGYVIPHTVYSKGYHANPSLPLPFMNIASQKNYVAFYHMGIYANEKLLNWFKSEYSKLYSTKLDMGKSCIRFKKIDQIPYELIGKLTTKISSNEWIKMYEFNSRK